MLGAFCFVSEEVLCLFLVLVVCRSVSRRLSSEIQEDDSSDDRDEAYEHEPSALVDVVHSSCAEREAEYNSILCSITGAEKKGVKGARRKKV